MSRANALNKLIFVIGLLFVLSIALQAPAQSLHHRLDVEILPGLKMLKANDEISFPTSAPRKMSFLLHKDLHISVLSADDRLTLLHSGTDDSPYAEYGLELGSDNKVHFYFFGVIYDPIVNDLSQGLISPEGAALFGGTYWYPYFLGNLLSFEITLSTPLEWRALTQGQQISHEQKQERNFFSFREIYPQEEIDLVAGPLDSTGLVSKEGLQIQVLLRRPDPALAQNFLAVIPDYIRHYSEEIGPYPYTSFSVIENFWETGYGMPSFTLLGPSVIRLPFIMNSSLPHEVLHNWWGNGVYVDYEKGNWSEGLTSYMADHWQQELLQQDAAYRLTALMNYEDYVQSGAGTDFPLRDFKGRHNSASQAVGYGKAMMFFHMLEFRLGKETFRKALRDFYKENLFRRASFEDIQRSFEKVSGLDLTRFNSQWLDRKGAPTIELKDVRVMRWLENSFSTSYLLAQTGSDLYELHIPVLWTLENGQQIHQLARLATSSQVFNLVSASRPLRIEVDPSYHLFRTLHLEERPATLSSILGSKKVHFFHGGLPEAADFLGAWKKVLEGESTEHLVKEELALPGEGAVVLLGDHPAFVKLMTEELQGQEFQWTPNTVKIKGRDFSLAQASFVVATRRKSHPKQVILWLRWSPNNNAGEWASRLTHYGKYGVLVFEGRPVVLKETWPILQSPLKRDL